MARVKKVFVEQEEEAPQGLLVATYNEAEVRFLDEEFQSAEAFAAAKQRLKDLLLAKRAHFDSAFEVTGANFKIRAAQQGAKAINLIWKSLQAIRPETLMKRVDEQGPYDFAAMVGEYQEKHWGPTQDVKLAAEPPKSKAQRRTSPQVEGPAEGGTLADLVEDESGEE